MLNPSIAHQCIHHCKTHSILHRHSLHHTCMSVCSCARWCTQCAHEWFDPACYANEKHELPSCMNSLQFSICFALKAVGKLLLHERPFSKSSERFFLNFERWTWICSEITKPHSLCHIVICKVDIACVLQGCQSRELKSRDGGLKCAEYIHSMTRKGNMQSL